MSKQITEQDLLDLKEKIDSSKTKVSELTGQKQALMKQLKDDWGCSTIPQAETKLAEMSKQADGLQTQIDNELQALEEEYDFNQ